MKLNIKAKLTGTALNKVDRLSEEVEKFDSLGVSAQIIKDKLKNRFLQTVDPDGTFWEESIAAQRRAARGKSGKTLFNTGRLYRSIQIHDRQKDSVEVGVNSADARNTRIGRVHQVTGFRGVIRRFIGLNHTDITAVEEELNKRLTRLFK